MLPGRQCPRCASSRPRVTAARSTRELSYPTACVVPGSVAAQVAGLTARGGLQRLEIEHPTGFFTVEMDVTLEGAAVTVKRSALLRTARKLMRGEVFVPGSAWSDA